MPESCYYIWDIVLTSISILATVALSIIAVWQNSRYKKLADRKDEARKAEIDEENRLKFALICLQIVKSSLMRYLRT